MAHAPSRARLQAFTTKNGAAIRALILLLLVGPGILAVNLTR